MHSRAMQILSDFDYRVVRFSYTASEMYAESLLRLVLDLVKGNKHKRAATLLDALIYESGR